MCAVCAVCTMAVCVFGSTRSPRASNTAAAQFHAVAAHPLLGLSFTSGLQLLLCLDVVSVGYMMTNTKTTNTTNTTVCEERL